MLYKRLNIDWNADPNAPDVKLSVLENTDLSINFLANSFLYDTFEENDRCKIIFKNCHKYIFNNTNDEAYYKGNYRFKNKDLPWGEFYLLNNDWQSNFHIEEIKIKNEIDSSLMNHYIFFFRDNTLECVAENFKVVFYKNLH